ncbi:MAG: hypothetical protein M3297_10630 [Thermoproteota archaeon]|nr:hypothetical protein [Thermoproteota archaeon]
MTVSGGIITSDPEPAPDDSINVRQGEDKPLLSSSSAPETKSAGNRLTSSAVFPTTE